MLYRLSYPGALVRRQSVLISLLLQSPKWTKGLFVCLFVDVCGDCVDVKLIDVFFLYSGVEEVQEQAQKESEKVAAAAAGTDPAAKPRKRPSVSVFVLFGFDRAAAPHHCAATNAHISARMDIYALQKL